MSKLSQLVRREPVRVYLYGLSTALVGALVAFGLVTNEQGVGILGVATALAAIPAIEVTRSKVRPVRRRDP